MQYIDAIKGTAFAFVLFVILTLGIPELSVDTSQAQIILTVSTFLFAIIAGFFLSRLNGRYDKIRELVATEDALWLSFYKNAMYYGKAFSKKVAHILDAYYREAFDYDLGKYYKPTARYIHQLYVALQKVSTRDPKALAIFSLMVETLSDLEESRNNSAVITQERLTKGQWIVLIFLSVIILISIFALKTNDIFSQMTTILLATILMMVLLIIRDLENFRLGGSVMVEESGEEIFEFIGELRYYSQKYIDEGTVKIPPHVKKYRVGLHEPGEKPRIKIVANPATSDE